VRGEAGRSSSKGGKQPGEERPFDGVNNVVVGERIRTSDVSRLGDEAARVTSEAGAARRRSRWGAEILGAAGPQGQERQGGRRDPRGSGGDERGEASEGRVPMDDPV